jgi:hypothetical protein
MKRFLLFSYDDYYPCGGWNDFDGDFDTVEAAKEYVLAQPYKSDAYTVVDTTTKQVVEVIRP